ncbi:MAG: hypothetical protein V4692_14145 [Bdellovibrionota bacterium]
MILFVRLLFTSMLLSVISITASADPGEASYSELSLEVREDEDANKPGVEISRTQIVTIESNSDSKEDVQAAFDLATRVMEADPTESGGPAFAAPNRALIRVTNGEMPFKNDFDFIYQTFKGRFRPHRVSERAVTGESLAELSRSFGDRTATAAALSKELQNEGASVAKPEKAESKVGRYFRENKAKITISIIRALVAGNLAAQTIIVTHGFDGFVRDWGIVAAAAPTGIMSALFCLFSKQYGRLITSPFIVSKIANDPAGSLRLINKYKNPLPFKVAGRRLAKNINPLSFLKFQIPEKTIDGVQKYAANPPLMKIFGRESKTLTSMQIAQKLSLYFDQFFKSTLFLEVPFVIISGLAIKAYREPYIHISEASTTAFQIFMDVGMDIVGQAFLLAQHAMVGIFGAGAGQLFADQAIEIKTQNKIHKLRLQREQNPESLSEEALEKKIKRLEVSKDTFMAINSMFQVGIVAFMAQGYDWANTAIWGYLVAALAYRFKVAFSGMEGENLRFEAQAKAKESSTTSENPVVKAAESVSKSKLKPAFRKVRSCSLTIAS